MKKIIFTCTLPVYMERDRVKGVMWGFSTQRVKDMGISSSGLGVVRCQSSEMSPAVSTISTFMDPPAQGIPLPVVSYSEEKNRAILYI